MHRLSKTQIKWSSNFAYAIGLIVTDGCLYNDGRHVDFTSKDKELVLKFRECLGIQSKIGIKYRGGDKYKKLKYFRVQLGDVNFYDFLLSIGLGPRKSRSLGSLEIPRKFFTDFLRGCIDGDGSIGFYNHPESKHPQLRVRICSASLNFLKWLKREVKEVTGINSGWIDEVKNSIPVLCYAKADSIILLSALYKNPNCVCLLRKREVVKKFYGRVAELGIRA